MFHSTPTIQRNEVSNVIESIYQCAWNSMGRGAFISIVFGMIALCGVQLKAQDTNDFPTPCQPCKIAQRDWSQIPATSTIITIGECSYRVWYKKRLCSTDGCQELKLEKIEPQAPIAPSCGGKPIDELVTLVLGNMVENNSMNFQPDEIGLGSSACWRIIRPACWALNETSSHCAWWPTGASDTTGNRVNFQDGEYVPCDSTKCCTHMLFPTRDLCGDLSYNTPLPGEYPWLLFLRTEPEDPDDHDDYDASRSEFEHQYDSTECVPCAGVVPPPIPPTFPPLCKNHCRRDLMMEYRRLLNAKLKELYGE